MKNVSSLVLSSAPDHESAKKIAKSLIEESLAACVHISNPITSFYQWKGKTCEDQEYQLWIKTKEARFKEVSQKICERHPFEVPEVVSIPIEDGLPAYMEWILEEVK